MVAKTFVKQNGVISRFYLTIRPQSDNVLTGQITQAGYVEVDEEDSDKQDSNDGKLNYLDIPLLLNKPFKIHLRNGAICSLSVDREWTNYQINLLKVIVSQFQVDTKAQNVMQSADNRLPERNGNNAFYKTMEPTVYGQCETVYDISGLPEYLTQSNREWVPLPDLVGEGQVIQVVKNTNYQNCNERTHYLINLFGQKEDTNRMNNNVMASQKSRIFISGSLNDYTIQSAVITNKVADLNEYIYVTLESVEQRNTNYGSNPRLRIANYNNYESNPRLENLLNVENLLYKYDLQKNTRPTTNLLNNASPSLTDSQYNDGAVNKKATQCNYNYNRKLLFFDSPQSHGSLAVEY